MTWFVILWIDRLIACLFAIYATISSFTEQRWQLSQSRRRRNWLFCGKIALILILIWQVAIYNTSAIIFERLIIIAMITITYDSKFVATANNPSASIIHTSMLSQNVLAFSLCVSFWLL